MDCTSFSLNTIAFCVDVHSISERALSLHNNLIFCFFFTLFLLLSFCLRRPNDVLRKRQTRVHSAHTLNVPIIFSNLDMFIAPRFGTIIRNYLSFRRLHNVDGCYSYIFVYIRKKLCIASYCLFIKSRICFTPHTTVSSETYCMFFSSTVFFCWIDTLSSLDDFVPNDFG